jgi:acyl-CoA thioester hydrolase
MSEVPTRLEDFVFTHKLRVRWAELDPQRIVYNAHYLTYFDVGLTEYLRALGWKGEAGFAGHGTDMVLANANLDYRASARHDDELLIAARIEHLGRRSFRFRMGCFRVAAEPRWDVAAEPRWDNEATLLVEGRLAYAHVGRADLRPAPLPEAFIAKVLAFERLAPTRPE